MFLFHSKKAGFNLQALDVLMLATFFASATYGIKAIVSSVGLSAYEDQASLIWYILWSIVYGRFLWYNKKMLIDLVIAESVYAILLYLSYNSFPDTREFYEDDQMFIRQIAVVYIPSLTVALKIKDFSGYLVSFRTLGFIGLIFMILAYFMNYMERWDYQYYGVQICPFILMIFASYLQNKKRSDLVWVLVGFIFLMSGGRQSFVGFFAGMAVVYYCLRLQHLSLGKIIKLTSFTLIGLLVLVISLPFFLDILGGILNAMGMDSRTMEMLSSNELTSTSTRDDIYELSIYYAKNNLYDIKGFYADRYLLRAFGSWIAYPHNLVLELMIDLGVLIGGTISIIILGKYAIRVIKGNTDKRTVIGILATLVLVRLMVSSSFMIEGSFYTILGLLFNTYDDKNTQENKATIQM